MACFLGGPARGARTLGGDDSVEEASKPSDVANVRDVAMDDEHAATLTAGVVVTDAAEDAENSLSLDPVGVLLQSSEAVAGGIFSGMRDLLQCGVDRATPEQPVDEPSELGQGEEDMPSRTVGSDAQHRKCARMSQPIDEYTHTGTCSLCGVGCNAADQWPPRIRDTCSRRSTISLPTSTTSCS